MTKQYKNNIKQQHIFKNKKILYFRTYTNELLEAIIAATCIKSSSYYKLVLMDLSLSILINSKLVQKILHLTEENITNLKSWIAYDYHKKINKNIVLNHSIFSDNVLLVFKLTEWIFKKPNTLGLFYVLYIYFYEESIEPIFKVLKKEIKDIFIEVNENIIMGRININIPINYENILKQIKFDYSPLIGRKQECLELIDILKRVYQRNPIIIGEYGIGKSKLIEKVAFNLNKKVFLYLDITNLLHIIKKETNIIHKIIFFVKSNTNIILILEDINLLFDSSLSTDILFFINFFIKALNTNKIQLIGTIKSEIKYQEMINTFGDLKYIFYTVTLKELNKDEIIEILQEKLNKFNYNEINLKLNCTLVDFKSICDLSTLYIKNIPSPIKEILILDSICSKYKVEKKIINIKQKYTLNIFKSDIVEAITKYTKTPSSFIDIKSNSCLVIDKLKTEIHKRIFGQDQAIKKIISTIQRTMTGLKEKNKPIGSWLLCGPSGTGKTELVKSLAATLFGSESDLIKFDMSEFKEANDSVKLIGCPPGYVGYEKGGVLTSAVKKKPYSVILFDEIEKAHINVNDLMLQILDEGILTDSFGEKFDFTNTIIIFTSNLGCPKHIDSFKFKSIKQGTVMNEIEYEDYKNSINKAIKEYFRPELLNRLTEILIFNPLTKSSLLPIAYKYISAIQNKLISNNVFLYLDIEEKYLKSIITDIFNPLYGARPLKRKIEEVIENPISEILSFSTFIEPYKLSILVDNKIQKTAKQKNYNKIYYIYTSLKSTNTIISNVPYTCLNENEYEKLKKIFIKIKLEKEKVFYKVDTIKNTYYLLIFLWYKLLYKFDNTNSTFKFLFNQINTASKHTIK